eukprot:CAMPEP_0114609784 /NCGR_PEP_ID=MMETSP0168-20121206/3264_1 /TAXON_ID=95228 ORGANISM="Vannella sp., Strain DIVA3 517/6/12" /NCGR_SAMPLE_ID=MMETSP0168 /ASSEMBLY_ACC=CAM_ASM_000044 /LENGTH=580 /DNA_ID=CAMNT_0001820707 /DNA_START=33 /DNA_END=1772 /DNA_ORIENTATION=+
MDAAQQQNAERALKKSISSALSKLATRGDRNEYLRLIKAMEVSPHATRILWFRAFSSCVTLITQACSELVAVIIRYDFNGDDTLNDTYEQLLRNLISSNRCFLEPTLRRLVALLVPPNIEELPVEHKNYVDARVHHTIRQLAGIVPSVPSSLFQVLVDNFPHKSASVQLHETYVTSLFTFARSFPMLQDRIMAVVIERMIHIDVEIVVDSPQGDWSSGDEGDHVEDDDDDEVLLFDLEEQDQGNEGAESVQAPAAMGEMASKLDVMMRICFQFLDECDKDAKVDSSRVFHVLLEIFDHAVLHTHKSKFVQYLVFYQTHKSEIFVQQFMSYLLNKALSPDSSPLTKELCIAYAGSFVARSSFISTAIVQNCLLALSRWAEEYIQHARSALPDPQAHRLFYVLCQTIFYILCFAAQRLLDASTKDEVTANFGLFRLVQCKLNPLRVCNQVIVAEFLATLEACRMDDLSAAACAVMAGPVPCPNSYDWQASEGMRLFFPFEPYVLRNSFCFVKSLYIDWVKLSRSGDYGTHTDEMSDDSYTGSSYGGAASASLDVAGVGAYGGSIANSLEDMMSFTPDLHYEV